MGLELQEHLTDGTGLYQFVSRRLADDVATDGWQPNGYPVSEQPRLAEFSRRISRLHGSEIANIGIARIASGGLAAARSKSELEA